MSNLKHGFYSTNESINPDSVMVSNIEVKKLLKEYEAEIKQALDEEMLKPGVLDLVVYLIDCVLPHSEHLLPKGYEQKANEFYRSKRFAVINRVIDGVELKQLLTAVQFFR